MVEARIANPMVPLEIFRSQQFSGANAVTFAVYAALGAVTFLLVVHLQTDLGYSALEAGASLLPITACMLLLSARAGALAQRIGPRWPMTVGPLVVAVGMVLLGRVEPGTTYWDDGVPGDARARARALAHRRAAHRHRARRGRRLPTPASRRRSTTRWRASRACSRCAVLPGRGRAHRRAGPRPRSTASPRAMYIAAVLAAVGGVLACLTIRRAAFVEPVAHANPGDPVLRQRTSAWQDLPHDSRERPSTS